ncbi:MAG: NAD(P)H-quinone oxidoreductase [Polyangiaceae bacterium]
MKAVVIREPGGPDVLVVRELPDLTPPPSFVRVAVRFTGVNRADLLQRMGFYPAPAGVPADIPGLEYSGVVDAVGPGVTRFAVGDRVCGLLGGGSYAEQVIAHEAEVARVPALVDDLTAAAVPEAFVTAYDAMLTRGGLAPGETVLVHAGGSGVGTAAIQLAKALGCFVIATSRTADKLDRCKELGADVGLVVEGASFERGVMEATNHRGADVIVDLVGGAYVAEDVRAAATLGRIVVVGLTAGLNADVDLGLLLRRRVTIVGTVLRSRPLAEKILAAEVLERNVLPLVAAGRVRPVIDRVLPLAEAPAAHTHVASNTSFGKVMLDAGSGAGGGASGGAGKSA